MRDAEFIKIAKCLADPTRHRMLKDIRDAGELNCSQICGRFDLSQPTISHHIKTLSAAGLITVRESGQFHVLTVNEETLRAFAGDLTGAPAKSRK